MAKRKRRTFTPEFKGRVVLEALSGESSQAELCRRHNLSEDQLSKWKKFTSTTMILLPRRETASVILSNTSITRNAPIRR